MDFQPAFLVSALVCPCLVIFLVLYMKIRPKFPVRVTCWFCHEDTKVPFGNKNCWDCPKCDQYNGFTKDGDYNKVIPAQFDSSLNHNIGCQPSEFLCFNKQLCGKCNNNEHLKARLLADFQPRNKNNYDEEIKAHAKRLDKWYDICMNCQITVQEELQKQDAMLSQKLNSHYFNKLPSSSTEHQIVNTKKKEKEKTKKYIAYEKIGLSCILFLVLSSVYKLFDENIVDFNGNELSWLPSDIELLWILTDLSVNNTFIIIGLLTTLISKIILLSKYRLHPVDLASVTLWIVSGLLQCIFNQQTSHITFIYMYIYIANLVFTFCSTKVKRQVLPQGIRINRFSLKKTRYSDVQVTNGTDKQRSDTKNKSDVYGNLNDTVSGLEAFTLGTAKRKQQNPGIFSSKFTTPEKTGTFPKQLSASRPLISPAKLNIMKFTNQSEQDSSNYTSIRRRPTFSSSGYKPTTSTVSIDMSSFTTTISDSLADVSSVSGTDKMAGLSSMPVTDKLIGSSTIFGKDTDTDSSRSSLCPVDSTTSMEDNKGMKNGTKSIGVKKVIYTMLLLGSLGLNAYLTWKT